MARIARRHPSWTEENFFSFDAYSCKDFDPEKALDYVLQFFDVQSYNGLDIVRTIDAPQSRCGCSTRAGPRPPEPAWRALPTKARMPVPMSFSAP